MKKYDHKAVEKKWQARWEKEKPYRSTIDSKKPKYYVLDMFPYPSGAGLHVGHLLGYTGTDITARFKRQRGFNVLHPMGWDSFGLPAEQYAIRTGTHPSITTDQNIATFKRQLKAVGFSYDWDREIATSSPDYYKWTQWIFTKLYEKGLAYEAELLVNYCPALGSVLANEEVENGVSKDWGYPVERRPLKQWVLKITAYAERLLEDLKLLDWPEGLKKLQENWIGKSVGAYVDFIEGQTKEKITVFTTRADTLAGATFIVLSPEHPLVNKIATAEQKSEVEKYQKATATKSDLDRTELNFDKTGVFTGAFALHPLTQKKIPIWIADYVLAGYGTGAVMAVPAHDERDFDFAKKYALSVIPVIDPDLSTAPEQVGPEVREKVLAGQVAWPHGGRSINTRLPDRSLEGLSIAEAQEAISNHLETVGHGKRAVTYKLRDWLFSRQRYWGEPFPILHFEDGTKRVLDIDELPLIQPKVEDYTPTGDGKSPFAKAKDWVEIVDRKTGKKALRETNSMPQWAGSCWYYLRFADPKNDKEAWSKETENYWLPVDLYVGGTEHAVLHLLYARFWHKVLYDCGLVHTLEPFQRLFNQGMMVARSYQKGNGQYVPPEEVEEVNGKFIHKETKEPLRSQIDKMSKSKLNGVTPDEVIEDLGADSLRLYEMFMGPLDKEKVWNNEAVTGCRRFLNRLWDVCTSERVTEEGDDEGLKLAHRLLDGVLKDTEALQFNTAIAKMMEFMNSFSKLEKAPKSALKIALQCVFPFAPHMASELWEELGFKEDINTCPYPEVNQAYLHESEVTYVVQVNGKVRGRFELPKDLSEEEILVKAKAHNQIQKYLAEGTLRRVIFVPNKLLNLVIEK